MIDRKIQSCIISGATSMIGMHLTRCLLEKEIAVTAVIRPGSRRREQLPPESPLFSVVECELQDYASLELPKADAFFHLAWAGTEGSTRNDESAQMKNVEYTLSAVRAAEKAGCRVFLGAGSQAEYGFFEGALTPDTPLRPETAYGRAKKAAEEASRALCSECGTDHVWTRILSVYGPYDNDYTLVASAMKGFLLHEDPAFTAGEQIWDYLYAGDCAEAFYRLACHGKNGRAYPLGKGEKRLLKDYITCIRDAVSPGTEIRFGARPYNDHRVMYLTADISALAEDTGYRPDTDFADGIRKTAEWFIGRLK